MKTFILHWRTGRPNTVHGNDIADAMNKAGYGQGVIPALDYWEEVKPENELDVEVGRADTESICKCIGNFTNRCPIHGGWKNSPAP